MCFVEAAKFLEDFSPHHQAGGGNSAKILRQVLAGEVTRFMALDTGDMTGDTANSENDTAMLKGPVGIPQSCARNSNLCTRNLRPQYAQALLLLRFNIIVQTVQDRS